MTQQPGLNLRGAVDLAALARPAAPATPAGAAPGTSSGSPYTLVVDEGTFQGDVIELSTSVPVVVLLGSAASPASARVRASLEALSTASEGRWVLAVVDVTTSPRIAQAFGVAGVPAAVAVIGGRPLPLFDTEVPDDVVAQYVAELLRVAETNGMTGRVEPMAPGGLEEPDAPVEEPEILEAHAALDRDDLDAAAEAYGRLLARRPGDPSATTGVALVELLRRTQGADPVAVRAAAAAAPDDVAAQGLAADVDLLGGHVEDAFARLVETVRRTAGNDRTAARDHLVALFGVVGPQDPRVARARTALASALY